MFLLLFALSGCSRRPPDPPAPAPEAVAARSPAGSATPGVLVELFTSEGCSSCPPADRNLSRIVRNGDPRVVALSFHVDYWNYLGWRDPFSAARYSERQRQHARVLGGGVYTPEMVVNGRNQMLGSDEEAADGAIREALASAPRASLDFDTHWDERLSLGYRAQGPVESAICFAVAQPAHDVEVLRGENGGSTLSHENVVRAFECEPFRREGSVSFELPPGVERARALVAGWVEDASSHAVLVLGRS